MCAIIYTSKSSRKDIGLLLFNLDDKTFFTLLSSTTNVSVDCIFNNNKLFFSQLNVNNDQCIITEYRFSFSSFYIDSASGISSRIITNITRTTNATETSYRTIPIQYIKSGNDTVFKFNVFTASGIEEVLITNMSESSEISNVHPQDNTFITTRRLYNLNNTLVGSYINNGMFFTSTLDITTSLQSPTAIDLPSDVPPDSVVYNISTNGEIISLKSSTGEILPYSLRLHNNVLYKTTDINEFKIPTYLTPPNYSNVTSLTTTEITNLIDAGFVMGAPFLSDGYNAFIPFNNISAPGGNSYNTSGTYIEGARNPQYPNYDAGTIMGTILAITLPSAKNIARISFGNKTNSDDIYVGYSTNAFTSAGAHSTSITWNIDATHITGGLVDVLKTGVRTIAFQANTINDNSNSVIWHGIQIYDTDGNSVFNTSTTGHKEGIYITASSGDSYAPSSLTNPDDIFVGSNSFDTEGYYSEPFNKPYIDGIEVVGTTITISFKENTDLVGLNIVNSNIVSARFGFSSVDVPDLSSFVNDTTFTRMESFINRSPEFFTNFAFLNPVKNVRAVIIKISAITPGHSGLTIGYIKPIRIMPSAENNIIPKIDDSNGTLTTPLTLVNNVSGNDILISHPSANTFAETGVETKKDFGTNVFINSMIKDKSLRVITPLSQNKDGYKLASEFVFTTDNGFDTVSGSYEGTAGNSSLSIPNGYPIFIGFGTPQKLDYFMFLRNINNVFTNIKTCSLSFSSSILPEIYNEEIFGGLNWRDTEQFDLTNVESGKQISITGKPDNVRSVVLVISDINPTANNTGYFTNFNFTTMKSSTLDNINDDVEDLFTPYFSHISQHPGYTDYYDNDIVYDVLYELNNVSNINSMDIETNFNGNLKILGFEESDNANAKSYLHGDLETLPDDILETESLTLNSGLTISVNLRQYMKISNPLKSLLFVYSNVHSLPVNSRLHTRISNLKERNRNTVLLNTIYPQGCPNSPSAPSRTAVIAGACITLLKGMFKLNNDDPTYSRVQRTPNGSFTADGQTLQYIDTSITRSHISELNKLAYNIAMSRCFAGVNYRSDIEMGIRLGEKYAIKYLRDKTFEYNETRNSVNLNKGFILETFDGKVLRIRQNNISELLQRT